MSNLINIKRILAHTQVQNMGLLRHHMTISQYKYQTCVVNRYAFDYSLFSIYIVLRLLETLISRCVKYRSRLIAICLLEIN